MKKLISVIVCLAIILLTGCSSSPSDTTSLQTVNSELSVVTPYKTVIMKQQNGTVDKGTEPAYKSAGVQALDFAKNSGSEFTEIETTKETAVSDIISQAVQGAKTFICIGKDLTDAVLLCSQSYQNLNFVLFDGYIAANELPKNVLQFSFAYEEAGFVIGYSLVYAGIRNIGFAADDMGVYERQILNGIIMGSGYAANEKNNPLPQAAPEGTESSDTVSSQPPVTVNRNPVKITVEKYDLSALGNDGFIKALDTRKTQNNMRIVCIGDKVADIVSAHTGGFYMFTDSAVEYSRKYAQVEFSDQIDILSELEMISTAGEGWAQTYGKRSVKFTIADGKVLFPIFKLSNVYYTNATGALSANRNDLSSDRLVNGYGYVTETDYVPAVEENE